MNGLGPQLSELAAIPPSHFKRRREAPVSESDASEVVGSPQFRHLPPHMHALVNAGRLRSSADRSPQKHSRLASVASSVAGPEPFRLETEAVPSVRNLPMLRWAQLAPESRSLYLPGEISRWGAPTAMDVHPSLLAVGTSRGFITVFDEKAHVRLGTCIPTDAASADPVTALRLSQDATHLVSGHASGLLCLFSLERLSAHTLLTPQRHVSPTTLPRVLKGTAEGHIINTSIVSLAFVGASHAEFISADESGMAFYHILGKVLLLASADTRRILGRYPDPNAPDAQKLQQDIDPATGNTVIRSRPSKPASIFQAAALPAGAAPHLTDSLAFAALITPTKLVIVGLKPQPRTWHRVHVPAGVASSGCLAWWPRTSDVSHPILAFAWERSVHMLNLSVEGESIQFAESKVYTAPSPVLGVQWYNSKTLIVLTKTELSIVNTQTKELISQEPIDSSVLVAKDVFRPHLDYYYKGTATIPYSYTHAFQVCKRKLFFLTLSDLRSGIVLSWADQVLDLMNQGAILEAIDLTTSYLLGLSNASTLLLPQNPAERTQIIVTHLKNILDASVDYVFSEDRLRDGSHSDGEAVQRLFHGLVKVCVRACLAIDEQNELVQADARPFAPFFLFSQLYDKYDDTGIEPIFLEEIEPFLLDQSIYDGVPPIIPQRLLDAHDRAGEYEAAERLIWHVNPASIDLNQALTLCTKYHLYDALVYVYTQTGLHDFASALAEFVLLIDQVQTARHQSEQDLSRSVAHAYKVFAFLTLSLSGQTYPNKTALSAEESENARTSILAFLLSEGETVCAGVVSVDPSSPIHVQFLPADTRYPYLQTLLRFDAEPALDVLDYVFEQSYLDDEDAPSLSLKRQYITDALLMILTTCSENYTSNDRAFLGIFLSRNIPKYPQYIHVPAASLHAILLLLTTDKDQSTVDDRQLAVEYLLSVYVPDAAEQKELTALYEEAHFYNILRDRYRAAGDWVALLNTYLADPHIAGQEMFEHITDVFSKSREGRGLSGAGDVSEGAVASSPETKASSSETYTQLAERIIASVPLLLHENESSIGSLASLVDTYLPEYHGRTLEAIKEIAASKSTADWQELTYLRTLLEAGKESHLPYEEHLRYLSLLCQNDPGQAIAFMQQDTELKEEDVLRITNENNVLNAAVWALDHFGKTRDALRVFESTLKNVVKSLFSLLCDESDSQSETSAALESTEEGTKAVVAVPQPSLSLESTATSLLRDIDALVDVTLDTCVRRGEHLSRDESQELWFSLLQSLVVAVQTARTAAVRQDERKGHVVATQADGLKRRRSSLHRKSSLSAYKELSITRPKARDELVQISMDVMDELIPKSLSLLVSRSYSHVSFPALVRRLITSYTVQQDSDSISYHEFKLIITGMLDSYVFEVEILKLAARICQSDVYECLYDLGRKRLNGWTFRNSVCEHCKASLLLEPRFKAIEGQNVVQLQRDAIVEMATKSLDMASVWYLDNKETSSIDNELAESIGIRRDLPVTRPPIMKRPSIKGKEVAFVIDSPADFNSAEGHRSFYDDLSSNSHTTPYATMHPQNQTSLSIVVLRDGRGYHSLCFSEDEDIQQHSSWQKVGAI